MQLHEIKEYVAKLSLMHKVILLMPNTTWLHQLQSEELRHKGFQRILEYNNSWP